MPGTWNNETCQRYTQYVYGTRPNVPEYALRGGQVYRIITDHLGSVRLVVNATSGAVLQRMEYAEFGVLDPANDYVASGWKPLPFGFAGGLYDRDTKLVRFGARDYDALTGRWTAKDPIRFAGGDTDLYGYVVADPIYVTDPRGLEVSACSLTHVLDVDGGGRLGRRLSDRSRRRGRHQEPFSCRRIRFHDRNRHERRRHVLLRLVYR